MFLDGKGVFGLGRWFRGGYLGKIAKNMKSSDFGVESGLLENGDHPYNDVSDNTKKGVIPYVKHNIL